MCSKILIDAIYVPWKLNNQWFEAVTIICINADLMSTGPLGNTLSGNWIQIKFLMKCVSNVVQTGGHGHVLTLPSLRLINGCWWPGALITRKFHVKAHRYKEFCRAQLPANHKLCSKIPYCRVIFDICVHQDINNHAILQDRRILFHPRLQVSFTRVLPLLRNES